eukprot:18264_1
MMHLSKRTFSTKKPSAVARAIHKASLAIRVNPTSRPVAISSKRLRDRLSARQRKVSVVTPSYLQPLFKTHYIPDYHIPPRLKYPRFPSPKDCVHKSPIYHLVETDEKHISFGRLPDKFAIFAPDHHQNRQFKVMKGDRIMVSLYYNKETGWPYNVGDKVIFDNILCIGSREYSLIGRPLIPGPRVIGIVEEKTQTAKKIWIRKKQRCRKKRIIGSREWVTIIRILDIECNFEDYVPLLNNDNINDIVQTQ